jgi:nitrate reductase / nitrite oxidoreductase, beta subunit
MSNVLNWQLGRDMEYPYDAAYPDRQFAFVFNLNRCIGCQSCTMACKSTWTFSKGQEAMWWNNVETKPYGGYPHHWDVKLLDLLGQANPGGQTWNGEPRDLTAPYGQFKGKTIFEVAKTNISPEGASAPSVTCPPTRNGPRPIDSRTIPRLRRRGTRARWLSAEVNSGRSTRPGSSTWPGSAITAVIPPASPPAPATPSTSGRRTALCWWTRNAVAATANAWRPAPTRRPIIAARPARARSASAAFPRVEGRDPQGGGVPMQTRCMAACVGHIRLHGLVQMNQDGTWKEDRQHPLYYLVHVAKVALPLYPQFGTEPNGYYIPPRWVPLEYLRQMFGPGADAAVERYAHPDRELLAVLQLFGKDARMCFRYEIKQGPKSSKPPYAGRSSNSSTTPSSATPRMGPGSWRPRSRNRSTCGHAARQLHLKLMSATQASTGLHGNRPASTPERV